MSRHVLNRGYRWCLPPEYFNAVLQHQITSDKDTRQESRNVGSRIQSTITEKMAAVHFSSNALRFKIFKKANECLLKDRRQEVTLFSNFQLTLAMHPGKMYMPPSLP